MYYPNFSFPFCVVIQVLLCQFQCLSISGGAIGAGSACYSHRDCPGPDDFCSWTTCHDVFGRTHRCGICAQCASCRCNFHAVDSACPRDRCPAQPTDGICYLQGSFYGFSSVATGNMSLEMPLGYLYVQRVSFVGSTFHEMQASRTQSQLPPLLPR